MSHSRFYQFLLFYLAYQKFCYNLIAATTSSPNNEACNTDSDSQIYIQEKQDCYLKTGSSCRNLTDSTSQDLECVPGAFCDYYSGQCNCTRSHYETDEGSCAPKHLFTESCSVSKQCIGNLECIKGKCLCDPRKKLGYHHGLQRCSTLAGHLTRDCNCVENAYCYGENLGERCRCGYEFGTTSEGFCVSQFGYSCNALSLPCDNDKGLSCRDGKCLCLFSGQMWVTDGHQECQSTPGQPCSAYINVPSPVDGTAKRKLIMFNCTGNQACLPRQDNDEVYECQCSRPGYVQVGEECLKDFGNQCNNSTECDTSRNMQCVNNQCDCALHDLEYYDEKEKICRGLEGAECGWQGEQFCTPGSSCMLKNEMSKDKTCVCLPEYRINRDRKCEKTNMKTDLGTTEKLEPNKNES